MAIVDLYHYDRALRAATEHGKQEPVRRGQIRTVISIPAKVAKMIGTHFEDRVEHVPHRLSVRPFAWTTGTPVEVVDAVAKFVTTTPPDELWSAYYEQYDGSQSHIGPIIYAGFVDWHIEVARWE